MSGHLVHKKKNELISIENRRFALAALTTQES